MSIEIQNKTKKHYQETPFVWGQKDIKDNYFKYSGVGKFLRKSEADIISGKRVLDSGSGSGIVSAYLTEKGLTVYPLDLSETSLHHIKIIYGLYGICATNMCLPFKDNYFNIVISSGVVHHTPDAKKSVEELVRVLKPGGIMYLLIYRKESIQYYEYTIIHSILSVLSKNKTGKYIIDTLLVFLSIPLIYFGKAMLFRTLKGNTFQDYKNYFYDRYMTPQATFHSRKEVEEWFREYNIGIVDYYAGNFGYHHNFICKKYAAKQSLNQNKER